MRILTTALLRLFSQTYFLLASLYCFLAFIPYTYLFVIVNPPYQWLITFAHYNLLLLWIAIATSVVADWPLRFNAVCRIITGAELGFALIVSIDNPVFHIRNDGTALGWGIGFQVPILIRSAYGLLRRASTSEQNVRSSIAYSDGIIAGLLTALVSIAALRLQSTIFIGPLPVQRNDAELMLWVVVEHVTFAIALLSVINLARSVLSMFTDDSFILGPGIVGSVIFTLLAFGCHFFIEQSLSLHGWAVWGYSVLLSVTVTLSGLGLLLPMLSARKPGEGSWWLLRTVAILLILFVLYVLVTIDPRDDWNGIIHKMLTLLLWVVLAVGIWRLRSVRKQYSIGTILVVALITGAVYETLNRSKLVWAADIGANRTQIAGQVENYADRNASFGLVDKMLGNQEAAPCDTACKTLRQYSNVRPPPIPRELKLVDNLTPTTGPKPNIFIIVIDSLRPDYLGIYNPRVDFTPHFDAFARDSIVMRRAYSNYAGTSLSEPSIWSGALLLHAHYAEPFQKINSLEKLARTDGYQIVLSYDVVLRNLIPDSSDLVKLDSDKRVWQQVELSSTMRQLKDFLDHRSPQDSPVLFYTQAMNIQVHADNNLPKRTGQNWQRRDGFEDRIAYGLHQTDEFFGDFIAYLKTRKLYDDSIIIVTSDHGDATGELGRESHSYIIYPEVMHVPLIVHLPPSMRKKYVYDENRIATLVDITPSLYYLLGHRPVEANPLFGRPIFIETAEEFSNYPRGDLLLASDCCAIYGILADDGRWMYTTYDSPSRSMLFDLVQDPDAQHNILTPTLKKQYDDRILQYLRLISKFYGHQPTGG